MGYHQIRGFTLIELLVALGIGVIILLLVTSVFRTTVNSLSKIRSISDENRLLRYGFMRSLEDIDFWHSHANPQLPYNKSDHHTQDFAITDKPVDRRSFAPVHFSTATDFRDEAFNKQSFNHNGALAANGVILNPNVYLAHDPRSNYRGHYWWGESYYPGATHLLNDYRATWRAWYTKGNFERIPITPYQVFGPYHLCENIDMRDPASSAGTPSSSLSNFDSRYNSASNTKYPQWKHGIDIRMNQSRPNSMFRIWQRLGDVGLFGYSRKGALTLLVDKLGHIPDWDSTPQHPSFSVDLQALAKNSHDYEASVEFGTFGANWIRTHNHGGFRAHDRDGYFFDLTQVSNLDMEGKGGMVLRHLAQQDSDWSFKWMNGVTGAYTNNNWRSAIYDAQVLATTVLLPFNITNNPTDFTTKPEHLPVVKKSIQRFHGHFASDFNVCRIELDGDTTYIMPFTTIGTTYRGARQHWALVGKRLGYLIGDHYVQP